MSRQILSLLFIFGWKNLGAECNFLRLKNRSPNPWWTLDTCNYVFKIPNNLSRSQYLAYPFHCALYYACREMKFRAMARRAYKPVTIICTFNHCTSPSTVHWVRSEPLSQDMHAPHTQRLSGDRLGSISMATWMKSLSRKGTCASKPRAYVDLFVFKQS